MNNFSVMENVSDALTDKMLDIFRSISNRSLSDNVFVSPLSIYAVLSMLYNGVVGEVEKDIKNFFGLEKDYLNAFYGELINSLQQKGDLFTLGISNSIWYRDDLPIKDEFTKLLLDNYQAECFGAKFDSSTIERINSWVKIGPNGKIDAIVDRLDNSAIMFLINCIYFNAKWEYEFPEQDTKKEEFYFEDGFQTTCDMMSVTKEFFYLSGDGFEAVKIPYSEQGFNMIVVLPNRSVSVNAIIGNAAGILDKGFYSQELVLSLPKFKFGYDLSVVGVVQEMGLESLFELSDCFNGIFKFGKACVTDFIHKAVVEVDESGTEAAAVSAMTLSRSAAVSLPATPKVFKVNRPFIFIIENSLSNTVFFMGKVINPLKS